MGAAGTADDNGGEGDEVMVAALGVGKAVIRAGSGKRMGALGKG